VRGGKLRSDLSSTVPFLAEPFLRQAASFPPLFSELLPVPSFQSCNSLCMRWWFILELTFVIAALCYCHYLPFSCPVQQHGHTLSIPSTLISVVPLVACKGVVVVVPYYLLSALISIESLSRSSFGLVPYFSSFPRVSSLLSLSCSTILFPHFIHFTSPHGTSAARRA